MRHKIVRGMAAAGFAAVMSLSSLAPAVSATVPAATVGSAAFQGGEYAPMDHNLIWIPWDDTIYSSYSACMRRGAYLAGVYTDIVDYQCRNRSTVTVRPTRFGMMLEVKRS